MPQWRRSSARDYWCSCWLLNRRCSTETSHAVESGWHAVRHAFATAVIGPFRDFMRRPLWPVILVAIFGYKLGEAMAGVMSTPLYISLGFSLPEIATASKMFGFFSIVAGALMGGVSDDQIRNPPLADSLWDILQSAGNLFFVLQAVGGHRIGYLALCVTAENLTGAMAGTALITYISSLCSPAFTATATQYALLSSLALLGRTVVASSGGGLSEKIGWPWFFVMTSVVGLPAFILFPGSHGVTISTRESSLSIARSAEPEDPVPILEVCRPAHFHAELRGTVVPADKQKRAEGQGY